MSEIIKNRYDFIVLFDVKNGNPNGDPDAGNMPRIDPETGKGIVTDVCIKRKIRNYVATVKEGVGGYRMYINNQTALNTCDQEAYSNISEDDNKKKSKAEKDLLVRNYMCSTFFDIRTFGAVMTTFVKDNLNCGQIRGPVQLGFAESIDPILPQDVTISRIAITTEKDAEGKKTELGRKSIVPYGLYRMEGYISANLARKTTGFTEDDLSLLWEALINMFDQDHSAARGNMVTRKLIIFKHDLELGNAPSHKLFDKVIVKRKEGIKVARSFSDYDVTIDEDMPQGVTLICME